MRHDFLREVAEADLDASRGLETPVGADELQALPGPAQRYMRFMNVVGRPRAWSFRSGFSGRFRPGVDKSWGDCEAWQYNRRAPIARYFRIRMKYLGPLPVVARDTYDEGEGRLEVRLLDFVTVADATGEPFDIGELVTWLNDAVLMAPSMLLGPEVSFEPVDDNAFDLALTDAGHVVRARVFVDGRGAPVDFSTTDRFYAPGHQEPVRTRWTTPVDGWILRGEQPTVSRAQAVWHFPDGPFPYADFVPIPGELVFNVAPGA